MCPINASRSHVLMEGEHLGVSFPSAGLEVALTDSREPHPFHYLSKEGLKPVIPVLPHGNEKKPKTKRKETQTNKSTSKISKTNQNKNPSPNQNLKSILNSSLFSGYYFCLLYF